jgi:hypothetical protein
MIYICLSGLQANLNSMDFLSMKYCEWMTESQFGSNESTKVDFILFVADSVLFIE